MIGLIIYILGAILTIWTLDVFSDWLDDPLMYFLIVMWPVTIVAVTVCFICKNIRKWNLIKYIYNKWKVIN